MPLSIHILHVYKHRSRAGELIIINKKTTISLDQFSKITGQLLNEGNKFRPANNTLSRSMYPILYLCTEQMPMFFCLTNLRVALLA